MLTVAQLKEVLNQLDENMNLSDFNFDVVANTKTGTNIGIVSCDYNWNESMGIYKETDYRSYIEDGFIVS